MSGRNGVSMKFTDQEQGEGQAHEQGESKSFEKKEDKGLVTDSADKRKIRKQAMGKFLRSY